MSSPGECFKVECGGPVEVSVCFGDLREALSFFECAGLAPSTLQFSESMLALKTVYGGLKLRALVAGQLE